MKDYTGCVLFLMLAEALRRLPADKRNIVITESQVHAAVMNRDTPLLITQTVDHEKVLAEKMFRCVVTNEPTVEERKKRVFNTT